MSRKKILGILIVAVLGCSAVSCGYPDQPKKTFGPKETTSLVIIFKKGVSQTSINDFEEHVISVPHESGSGIWSLPGMGSGYQFDKNDYKGMGINFMDNATDEQRQFIKQRILASDSVYCVYENIKPDYLAAVPCS